MTVAVSVEEISVVTQTTEVMVSSETKSYETIVQEVGGDNLILAPTEQYLAAETESIEFVSSPDENWHVVTVGPVQSSSGGVATSALFILDVVPTATGIVANKTYVNGTPELDNCVSDNANVRVHFGCEGGGPTYTPSVTVNGVPATVTESATKRWFIGYADIVLVAGVNTLEAISSAGGKDTATAELLGAGPAVLGFTFGAYPGTQTELKQGDTIAVTIQTEPEAVQVTIRAAGATGAQVIPVIAGVASTTLTISGATGAQVVTAFAVNSFGTPGADLSSSPLNLNQTYPNIAAPVVTYPVGKQGIDIGDTATVAASISNADTVAYSSNGNLTITNPSTYESTKTVSTSFSGYDGSGTNFTITATRAANGAVSTANALVRIASVAPVASISIPSGTKLGSSPSGVDYEVRITPSQLLNAAPSLVASHGTWQGAWTQVGSYWKRNLRITDAVARGAATFSGLSMVGSSGIAGNTITAGASYSIGGFSSRTVTFPAFSRVAPLGVAVAVESKLQASIGAQTLTRYTDNAVHSTGFYPANVDGTYNPNGTYMGLSDSAFAGSNTTGTLQATIQEVV